MKIKTKGQLKTVAPWWVGKTIKCGNCGFAAELEATDSAAVSAISERRPEGTRDVSISCPTKGCHGTAKFSEKLPKMGPK